MLYLLLAILSSTLFSAGLKAAEVRDRNRLAVAFWNYAGGALLAGAWWLSPLASAPGTLGARTALVGAASGASWVFGLLTLQAGIRAAGLALSAGFSRLSVVLPLLACLLVWGEALAPLEIAGVALAVLAGVLLAMGRSGPAGALSRQALPALLLLVLGQAVAQTSLKVFERTCPLEEMAGFLLVLFGSAALLSGALLFRREGSLCRREMGWGVAVGVPNLGTGLFITLALAELRGTLVFPLQNVGALVLLTLLGVFLWRERLRRLAWAGMLLAAASLLLLQGGT